jgi:hypothetical protein|tara:strand:- start:1252 stop:1542 length:291 start_codon:yes stop_codon:yes gene_type:complete
MNSKNKKSFEEIESNENFYLVDSEYNMVDNPQHYTQGRVEAIDVIEDSIASAPSPILGFLQGQVLKYMIRLWHKNKCKEDASKARWYLDRLIDSLD